MQQHDKSSTATALDTHKVRVTFFNDQYATTKSQEELTLPELRDRILAASAPTKAKLPWLKLVTFGKLRTDQNSLRHDPNVNDITGVELDYDGKLVGGKAVSFDEAIESVKRMGSRCLIYASPSNTLAAPHWRLLLPLSKPDQRKEMRKKYAARVNGFFGNIFSGESFTLSQSYYYGRARDKLDADHRAEIIDGKFIDLQVDDLYKYEKVGTPKDNEPDWEGFGDEQRTGRGFENILAELGDGPGLKGFHDVLTAAVASYVVINQHDLDREKLKTILRDAIAKAPKNSSAQRAKDIKRYNTDKFLDAAINSAIKKFATQPAATASGVPIIYIRAGKEKANAELAQKFLIAAGTQIYQRSGKLVRPIVEETDASDGRKTKTARLREVIHDFLNVELNELIQFKKYAEREKDWVHVRDRNVTTDVMSQEGRWLFPKLLGVITTPTMRPDGTLLVTPGYDPATRLLLVAPPPMPPIPDTPTRDDALAALQILESLIDECAFVDNVSQAVALSGIITPVVRGAFPITPMHVSRAAEAGSGKSYLWDIGSAIATGECMPVMTVAVNDEAEIEKRLTAALSSGQPLISLDNVNGQLEGDFLCQAIERTVLEIRPFGKNTETIRIEARGTSIFATGNNITLVGDVVRRAITATLDPRMERPETRQFKKDPVTLIKADRGKYIAACLTICRAYVVAGRPNTEVPLLSFKGWSDTVRSALIWLRKSDPVESNKATREEDPNRVMLLDMMNAWLGVVRGFGEHSGRTLSEMIRLARKTVSINDTTPLYPDLSDAFMAIAGKRSDFGEPGIDIEDAGNWLRTHKSIVRNMRFANKSNPKGGSRWWVEHLAGPAGERQYWAERAPDRAANTTGQAVQDQPSGGGEVPF